MFLTHPHTHSFSAIEIDDAYLAMPDATVVTDKLAAMPDVT